MESPAKNQFKHIGSATNTRPWDAERPTRHTKSISLSRTCHSDLASSKLGLFFTHLITHPFITLCSEPSLSATMSWPLKYDPASQSISFGGRDKTLYPNNLAPFDQAALAAGDVNHTYCDRDRERRPRPGNEHFEVRDEKVEDKNTEITGSEEDRCATDTSLERTTSIPYTKINQLEESCQKQKRFVKSLARGKWNRYRRQYSLHTSHEAHNSTDSLSTHDHTSTSPNFPTNAPHLTLSEARRVTLNNQAARELALKDRTSEGNKWSSDSFLVDPVAVILTTEKALLTVKTHLSMTEARLSTPPETCCSPQPSMGEKQTLIVANPPAPNEQFVYTHQNKKRNGELTVTHTAQNLFQRLLHPHDTIIKPALQLATRVFCLKRHNKIRQQSEKRASDADIAKNKVPSKRDVKEWRARRGYCRLLFSRKWVQSVAKAIEKGREREDSGRWGGCEKDGGRV